MKIKTAIKTLFTSASLMAVLNSCTYNNFRELNPEKVNDCDTSTAISYSAQIVPILNNNCTVSCHNGSGSGHLLTSWANVNSDAVSGALYGSVAQNSSYQYMPVGGSKLSICNITKIKLWAAAGAPNN